MSAKTEGYGYRLVPFETNQYSPQSKMTFHSEIRYEWVRGDAVTAMPCHGLYCARLRMPGGNFSDCRACPRGFRKSLHECIPWDQELQLYDWLYLGIMALLPIILHFTCIDPKLLKNSKSTIGLVLCAILEVVLSATITLLLWDPVGSFKIKSCGVKLISDWYPMFYNPHPNYEETLHCAHEVVYPLYTIILVFLATADAFMVIIRLFAYPLGIKVAKSIYSGLYFYPILALGHLLFGGLIYYIFPYITIVTSVVSCAYHFASRSNQSFKQLLFESLKDWRNVGIILCHWFLHAYGIVSITQLGNLQRDLCLLVLVPVPAILYILTANFTDPEKVHGEWKNNQFYSQCKLQSVCIAMQTKTNDKYSSQLNYYET